MGKGRAPDAFDYYIMKLNEEKRKKNGIGSFDFLPKYIREVKDRKERIRLYNEYLDNLTDDDLKKLTKK